MGLLKSRYLKGVEIGSGTFGNVYKGIDSKTGEIIAIKEITKYVSTNGMDKLNTHTIKFSMMKLLKSLYVILI